MAKILGFFLPVFIVALMLATTEISGDSDDKEVSRMETLFELYYFGFEFLRLVSKDMHKIALHGFGAKFQEYSREYYDLGLDVLDIANKHNMVFDFNEIALINNVKLLFGDQKKEINDEFIKSATFVKTTAAPEDKKCDPWTFVAKHKLSVEKELKFIPEPNVVPLRFLLEFDKTSTSGSLLGSMNILNNVQDRKVKNTIKRYYEMIKGTPICKVKKFENRIEKIINWIKMYDKDAADNGVIIPILEHIPKECIKVNALENKMSDLIRNGDSVTPDLSLEFLYRFNTRYLLKNIQNLKNSKDVHIKYKMKQLFLTHLFHRSKEILDLKKKLGRGDSLLQFFMDKALRGSKAKYQEFYKS